MKNSFIFFFTILLLFGCRNYNSENYISIENEAIKDIIPQITDFESMSKMNHKGIEKLKLYLISTLDTHISGIYEPKEEYLISVDGVNLSESEISENKTQNLKEIEKARNEKKLFADLLNGIIEKRELNYKFEYTKLEIEFISKIENTTNLKESEFGYLYISRIIFNRNFDKGYLSFSFFCGSACAWDNNIEIKKINGKWKVSATFSGGIA